MQAPIIVQPFFLKMQIVPMDEQPAREATMVTAKECKRQKTLVKFVKWPA